MRSSARGAMLLLVGLFGCDGGDGGLDASVDDDASLDAGAIDAPLGDDAPSVGCGDAVVGGEELCDGDAASCTALGGAYGGGNAPCRADCRGWDTSACTLAMPDAYEVVQPGTRDPRWADARCNDGTPFAFDVRTNPASHTWMFYLEGGAYCDDTSAPCSDRGGLYVTTLPYPDRALRPNDVGGLTSAEPIVNPDFAAANVVHAHYCSSDFWAGATTDRRPTTGDPGGWYFSGHRNVEAMLESLVAYYGLDDGHGDLEVLFGGGSAGGLGAHFNSSRVEALLPMAAAAGRVKILADAGWWFEWDDPSYRIGAATTDDHGVAVAMRDFWGATFDPQCEAEIPGDPASCLFGPSWYPRVSERVPVLIAQSLEDRGFAIATHGIADGTATMDAWHAQAVATLSSVSWLFAGGEPYHTIGDSDPALLLGPPGDAFALVVGRFFADSAPERVVFAIVPPEGWVDRADGQADPTSTSPIEFDVQLSEGVMGLMPTEIDFTGSTAPGTLVAALTPMGLAHYIVSVSGMTGAGDVVVSIPAGAGTDADGHPNVATASIDNRVTYTP